VAKRDWRAHARHSPGLVYIVQQPTVTDNQGHFAVPHSVDPSCCLVICSNEHKGENSKEPPAIDSGKEHNMLEEDSKKPPDSTNDDESISDEQSETIDEKAYRELEVTAYNLYLTIIYSTLTSGASSNLENVFQEDEIVIVRTEGELNARSMVDQSFADQLMKDSCFRDELKLMKKDEKSYKSNVSCSGASQSYVLSLHSAFENRYHYLCALRIWIKRRWHYLELNAEREGLAKFFEQECDRFFDSIPPIKAFQKWIKSIEDVKSLFSKKTTKTTPPAAAKKNEASNETTELMKQTSGPQSTPSRKRKKIKM
jgi:hypothetical protein